MKTQIIKRNNGGKDYFVIQEIVSGQGHYITWPGIYTTKESAQAEIDKTEKGKS